MVFTSSVSFTVAHHRRFCYDRPNMKNELREKSQHFQTSEKLHPAEEALFIAVASPFIGADVLIRSAEKIAEKATITGLKVMIAGCNATLFALEIGSHLRSRADRKITQVLGDFFTLE